MVVFVDIVMCVGQCFAFALGNTGSMLLHVVVVAAVVVACMGYFRNRLMVSFAEMVEQKPVHLFQYHLLKRLVVVEMRRLNCTLRLQAVH
jgi:hypothetical protein